MLLYQLDAWHRGTAPLPGKHRVNHHLIWRKASAEWISWQSFPTPLSSLPPRFLSALSPVQRAVRPERGSQFVVSPQALTKRRACRQLLGFPLPGDGYWNEHTVAAVGQRYPQMEMQPYADALPAPRL